MKTKSRVSIQSMPSIKSLRELLMSDAMSYYTEATENNQYVSQLREVTRELANKSALYTGLKKEYLCRSGTLEMLKKQKSEKNNFTDEELQTKQSYVQQLKEINKKLSQQIDDAQEELKGLFNQISTLKYSSSQIREDSEYTNVLIQINELQSKNTAKKQKIELLEKTRQEKQNTISILQSQKCDLIKSQEELLAEQKQIEDQITSALKDLGLSVLDTTIDKERVDFISKAAEDNRKIVSELEPIIERSINIEECEKKAAAITSANGHRKDTNQEYIVKIDIQNTKKKGYIQNTQPLRTPSSPPRMKSSTKSTASVFIQRIKERFDRRIKAVEKMNKETQLLAAKYENQAGPIQQKYEEKQKLLDDLQNQLDTAKNARDELNATLKTLSGLKDEERETLMQVNTAIRSATNAYAERSRIKAMKAEAQEIREEAERMKAENDIKEAAIKKKSEELGEVEVEFRRDQLMAQKEEDILKQLNSDIQEFLNQGNEEEEETITEIIPPSSQ
ncbi:hypothetical protein TVAG_432680 [Trichomonas vaginalis G3]|uniref:Uncharacterized protein n=1 Tax=Trichomonas vaginalis (strain ATCC PRA-98 / G3) TaxID=412133 RepID=A2DIQ9_TRIV3|nr:hypothetical protein TVAGG3_0562560 [Trichomonas vaginalis G3]EAY19672.1 hypothetical protein TVAG_432680 [Trichomonas vaginalis G3]KAI5521308.1 hypothetical protein TVAGG3_0562560 [Trichomonas vaginalis G3]|eukprot:XP_001580658.1 hypothetical protein [Trichomonas vaginalis G3]